MVRQFLAIAFMLLAVAPAQGQEARLPVPTSASQGPVLYKLKTDYKAEYARHEAADQLALAHTFFKEAAQSGVDPVRRYVLLREARELAVNGSDLHLAFDAIDEMARDFAIDGSELKVTAMSGAVGRSRAPPILMLDQYLAIAEHALSDGDIQMAYQASRLSSKIARESKDATAQSRAKQMELNVNEVNRQIKVIGTAADKLAAHPDDAEANLVVGKYWCFFRGGWEKGLPLLAKGLDPQLAELARADLANPPDGDGMIKLADKWWNLADSPQTPRRRSRERAAHWYELALPGLTDPQKAIAQQRINETKDH